MKAIGQIALEAESSIVFMDWDRRMAFVYYNRNVASYPLEEGPWYDLSFDIADIIKYKKVEPGDFKNYETVYVLESYSASPQASLFLDKQWLNERYAEMSERRRIERFLNIECRLFRPGIYSLYRCG